MKHLLAFSFVAALAACTPAPTPAPEGENADDIQATGYALTCEAFSTATRDELAARYGAENVVEQTIAGPEGEDYTATIMFPDDPARRLEFNWKANGTPQRISMTAANNWNAPGGLEVGQPLTEVETANGRPFAITGFGWDYGGTVTDWNGGALSMNPCRVLVRFTNAEGTDYGRVAGDRPFTSDHPDMRALNPIIYEISLIYPD